MKQYLSFGMFIYISILIMSLVGLVRYVSAKQPTTAFYGVQPFHGFEHLLVYGDNLITQTQFDVREDGVVTMLDPVNGIFAYQAVDLLKVTGTLTFKREAPNFRVELYFTNPNTGETAHYPLYAAQSQTDRQASFVGIIPLYLIGPDYLFQVIVHQENTQAAVGWKFNLLFEGVPK